MCRKVGLEPPDEEMAMALYAETLRLAEDLGLREAYHFLVIAVELARAEPYGEVLKKMQALNLSDAPSGSLP